MKITKREEKYFAKALIDLPSIGPGICMKLLDVASSLDKKRGEVKDIMVAEQLKEFSDALETVCRYSAVHQKVVIDRFKELVKG